MQTPRLFVWIFIASIALAMVPTLWPTLDLQTAAWFTGSSPQIASGAWWWVVWINAYIPALFRSFLLIAAIAWLVVSFQKQWLRWRLPLAFVVLSGILGPGALVNLGFKDNWQRARPYQVENFGGTQRFTRATVMADQCDANCSFVSGHVACGFFFTTLLLVHRRRRITWALTGTLAGLVIGFARISDVAHWLSDVLWAYPITLACSWLVWKVLCRVYKVSDATTPPQRPANLGQP